MSMGNKKQRGKVMKCDYDLQLNALAADVSSLVGLGRHEKMSTTLEVKYSRCALVQNGNHAHGRFWTQKQKFLNQNVLDE